MAREYQNLKPDGDWSVHRSLDETIGAARGRLRSGLKPYTLTKDGKTVRTGPRQWVLRGLRKGLDGKNLGSTFRIRAEGTDVLFGARETEPAVRVTDTNGNDKADRAWSVGKARYPDCSFLGAYVCKYIAGSRTMSQHSYGNALDFGRDTMNQLYDLAYYMVAHADELDLQHVIVDDRIWTRGSGWASYGGDRHYHVHVDFTPQYSGGCGVRG